MLFELGLAGFILDQYYAVSLFSILSHLDLPPRSEVVDVSNFLFGIHNFEKPSKAPTQYPNFRSQRLIMNPERTVSKIRLKSRFLNDYRIGNSASANPVFYEQEARVI